MTDAQLRRLRDRAHTHDRHCYGAYETCGEHHLHDDKCGGRPLICGQREDRDLLALLEAYDAAVGTFEHR